MIHPCLSLSFTFLVVCLSLPSGEIVMWDLTRTGKSKWSLFGTSSESQSHSRIVFNMSSMMLQDGRELLISTSMDREVRSSLIQNSTREFPGNPELCFFMLFFVLTLRLNAGIWRLWTAAGRCPPWVALSTLWASRPSAPVAWRWASGTTWSGCGTR